MKRDGAMAATIDGSLDRFAKLIAARLVEVADLLELTLHLDRPGTARAKAPPSYAHAPRRGYAVLDRPSCVLRALWQSSGGVEPPSPWQAAGVSRAQRGST